MLFNCSLRDVYYIWYIYMYTLLCHLKIMIIKIIERAAKLHSVRRFLELGAMAHKRGVRILDFAKPGENHYNRTSRSREILLCFLSTNGIFSSKTVDEHRRERNSRKLLVMFSWVHPCPLRRGSIDIDDGDNSTKRIKCFDFAPAHRNILNAHTRTYVYAYTTYARVCVSIREYPFTSRPLSVGA